MLGPEDRRSGRDERPILIDSHCHLDYPGLTETVGDVVERARSAGIGGMLTISTFVREEPTYRALAERFPNVWFSVGTHPHNAGAEPDVAASELVRLSAHPLCIAIGEAGLDYHYDRSPRDIQAKVFRTHIAAARDTGLPIIIHARDADDDMMAILRDEFRNGPFAGVLHCFSSGRMLAEVGVELGLHLSFSGILTFKGSAEIRRIAAMVPRDRLLVETDAPFLAPAPHRGRTNEPALVRHTAAVLAETIGLDAVDIAKLTTDNFFALFRKAEPSRLSRPGRAA